MKMFVVHFVHLLLFLLLVVSKYARLTIKQERSTFKNIGADCNNLSSWQTTQLWCFLFVSVFFCVFKSIKMMYFHGRFHGRLVFAQCVRFFGVCKSTADKVLSITFWKLRSFEEIMISFENRYTVDHGWLN